MDSMMTRRGFLARGCQLRGIGRNRHLDGLFFLAN